MPCWCKDEARKRVIFEIHWEALLEPVWWYALWCCNPASLSAYLEAMILQTSARNNYVRAEWLRQRGRAPSQPSATPRWQITPRPASIPRVALHIAPQSFFRRFFSLCRSPILSKHSSVVANCDHMSEWVHWVHACIWIAMQWVRCENLSTRCFYITIEGRRKMVRRYDTTRPWGSMQLLGCTKSRKERVGPNVGNDWVCIFVIWQDGMKWDAGYLPRGLPNIYSTSLIPPLLPLYLRSPTVATEQYTWRPWLIECGVALGGRDRAIWEMHLEAEMESTQKCTWRLYSIEFGDALGGCDRASLEMHLKAEMEWTQRCTWRPWLSEFGDALGSRDRVNSEDALRGRSSLEMHSDAVTEQVWRCSWRLCSSEIGEVLGGGRFGGRRSASWDSIHCLTCNCGNVESWVQHPPRDEKLGGSGRLSILGWCCTWCMQ